MAGRGWPPVMRPRDAWTLARLVSGHETNGEAGGLPEPFRSMADRLARVRVAGALAGPARKGALAAARWRRWQAMLAARPDRDELVKAVADADPDAPPPEADPPPGRSATLADLRRLVAESRWAWAEWLSAGVLNALAADPGT